MLPYIYIVVKFESFMSIFLYYSIFSFDFLFFFNKKTEDVKISEITHNDVS